MIKKYLLPASLFLGFIGDFLFWKRAPGISYPIFIILCLVAGFLLLHSEKHFPSRRNYWLFGFIVLFSLYTCIRKDFFTSLANFVLSILFTLLLSSTYENGAWVSFNLSDYIKKFFCVIGQLLALPWKFVFSEKNSSKGEKTKIRGSIIWQIVRGLLLAMPILIVFILLLSSADLIFEHWIEGLSQYLKLEDLTDYFIQGVFILTIAYFFIGLIKLAENHSHKNDLADVEKPVMQPFLGFTEGATILVCVIILFSIFVVIQFRYFFSGGMNIAETVFTYSEYARRGFGELIVVAIFCLMLIQSIRVILKIKNAQQSKTFIGLVIGLVLLVLVILTSSFQRLSLYESAYGFSRLRTYAHGFIIWLGVLLISIIALEIIHKPSFFTNATLLVVVGFILSLNLLNVDSLIVHQNIKRADMGMELDTAYLASLSEDAIPQLVEELHSSEHSSKIKNQIGAALSCHNHQIEVYDRDLFNKNWQSFHFADWKANKALKTIKTELDRYQVLEDNHDLIVIDLNGAEFNCRDYTDID